MAITPQNLWAALDFGVGFADRDRHHGSIAPLTIPVKFSIVPRGEFDSGEIWEKQHSESGGNCGGNSWNANSLKRLFIGSIRRAFGETPRLYYCRAPFAASQTVSQDLLTVVHQAVLNAVATAAPSASMSTLHIPGAKEQGRFAKTEAVSTRTRCTIATATIPG